MQQGWQTRVSQSFHPLRQTVPANSGRPADSSRLGLLKPGRGAALATALIVLAGCSAIGSMGRGLGNALLPGSSDAKPAGAASSPPASQRSASQPQRAPSGLPPDPNRTPRSDVAGSGGDMDARLARIEQQVAALRQDMDRTKPNIDRLVGIEDDIRVLLGQLSRLNDPNAPPVPARAAPATAPQAALPPPPANSAAVLGGPRSLTPIQPVPSQAAPSQTLGSPPQNLVPPPNAIAAAPAPQAGRSATTVAARDQLAVHIASYKEEAAARRGWQEMQAQQGNLLAGLDYRISPVTLSGGRGTFYRLKAGPFTDSASANEVCSALKARRVYCVVGDFSGTQ